MTRTFLGALALLTALVALVGSTASGASAAAATITFNGAVTDNYKNWDKTAVRERTAWLQLKSIAVGGVVYRPTTLPQDYLFSDTEPVTGSDGSAAVVSVSGDTSVAYLQRFRTDPNGDWGPLVVLSDPTTLPAKPLHLTVTVSRNGVAIASSVVDYLYDATLANAPTASVEYNSPGGRWWIGCQPTRTDWEAAAPASTCAAPASADVSVALVGPGNANVGDDTSLTLKVTNNGPSAASGVTATATLPTGLRLESVAPAAGISCTTGTPVSCSIGSLAAGAQATVRLVVAPTVAGALAVTAAATSAGTDPTSTNNSAATSLTSWGIACSIVGSPGPDTLTGSSARDVICGLGGNDTLSGGDGNDQFYGGDGNDTVNGDNGDDVIAGGPGDDTIHGGANTTGGVDRISFADAQSSMVVNMSQLHSWDDLSVPGDANVGYDVYDGIEAAIGSAFDDTMLGGPGNDKLEGVGGNDKLYGYGGDDVLDGGVGDDLINGGDGVDTATYAASGSAVTVDLALTAAQNTSGQGMDMVVNVENLTGSNYGDTLSGNALANTFYGGPGNDTLSGRDGNDLLHGDEGDDRLFGGNGNDLLFGDAGTDVLNGEGNTDSCIGGGQATDSRTGCEA